MISNLWENSLMWEEWQSQRPCTASEVQCNLSSSGRGPEPLQWGRMGTSEAALAVSAS